MTATPVLVPLPIVAPDARPRVTLTVWLADLTYTQQAISAETMPQAVAGIATYAATRVALDHPVRIFKYPEVLAAALEQDGPPDVIGFSHYIWNSQLSLAFADLIKERFPRTTVVFGGPHYPLRLPEQTVFWRERLAGRVDFYVDGEGEAAFADLLIALSRTSRDDVRGSLPGVHHLDSDGTLYAPPPRPRIHDLSDVPSPYTLGLMDEFFDGKLVPTVQTNRGCPFKCTFCQEGTAYFQKVAKKNTEHIRSELHYIGRRMKPLVEAGTARNELLITDSNFGMYPEDHETCRVIAECQQLYGWPRVVNVTTGKNQRDRVLSAVAQVPGAISLSGAVQSLDPGVLRDIARTNIDAAKLMEIALAAADAGTGTYSEVILALPGDSKARHLGTLRQLVDAGFNRLNMFQLTLLPGSEMCTDAYRREHGLVTKWRVMPRCYGSYTVLGEELRAAEVDEVCVTVPDMAYEDYRECRVMNLLLASLYNDGLFAVLLAVQRSSQISPMTWLERARTMAHGPALAAVLKEFSAETDEQLWEERADLLSYATGNIDQYIEGHLGNNLLYTYRTRILSEALDDTADLAARACLAVLREAGVGVGGGSLIEALVREAAEYHRLTLADVFRTEPPEVLRQPARFDLDALLAAGRHRDGIRDPRHFRLTEGKVREFVLTAEQRRTLSTYMGQFGTTPWGVGRLLTKVRLADIVRHVRMTPGPGTAPAPAGTEAPST
ncbi:B12-binding domain-containing radical SAM protein [Streptomyces sp. MUM 2J]|uniref:B12-binding domain-containing radical SAM protein n=1 Tax=Streptomyces sp. MUM 2J TaxID=2791987 RepID=UPI001F0428CB|nr:cobalamin-dependent protein [Streptomyces sp. MUM 2J]MCH0562157.1 cobalamin-dependent protein [Streptomyces sp. MUM 2J]